MERKFVFGKSFGKSENNYQIYNIIDNDINYYELVFNEKLQEKKFDSLESARKEGECIFKAQYIDRHPYDI
jgi:hypothetical protein